MPKCPICNEKLRRIRGLFECLTCQFVGDSARILRTKSLKNKGEARLGGLDAERDLLLDALRVLKTQGNEVSLKELLNVIDSDSRQNAIPTMAVRRSSRGKYVLVLASITMTAFAQWFVFNFSSLAGGNVTTLQAVPPFTFLLTGIGAFLYLMTR